MSNPKEALPGTIANDAIRSLLLSKGFPDTASIAPLKVTAEYHALYLIVLPSTAADEAAPSQTKELILRVSGNHLPAIKTKNEVGIMTWIRRNTSIPLPELIAWDASADNAIGHEYTLLSRAPGVSLSDVYTEMTEEQHTHILNQIIDFLVELHCSPWDGIGGLTLESDDPDGKVILSRVVDEDFWQAHDVKKYWSPEHSIETLNIRGPYESYIDLVSGRIQQYSRLIQQHETLQFMRDILPRLDDLVALLNARKTASEDPDRLNQVKIRLAHKDLHFANIIVDPNTADITAILDWEFAGVVPFIEWNPRRAFLWNARDDSGSMAEKQKWMNRFEQCCRERDVMYILEDAKFSSPKQESLHTLHNYLRAIVEVSPRGQRQDLVPGWKKTVTENLTLFGV